MVAMVLPAKTTLESAPETEDTEITNGIDFSPLNQPMSTKQTLIFLPKSISSQASFEAEVQRVLIFPSNALEALLSLVLSLVVTYDLLSIKQDSLVIPFTEEKDMYSNITSKDAITIRQYLRRGLDICYSDK